MTDTSIFSDEETLLPVPDLYSLPRESPLQRRKYGSNMPREKHVHFSAPNQARAKPIISPKIGLDDYEMKYQSRTRKPSFSGSAELDDVDRYTRQKEKRMKGILKPPRKDSRKGPDILGLLIGGRKKLKPRNGSRELPWKRGYAPLRSEPVQWVPLLEIDSDSEVDRRERVRYQAGDRRYGSSEHRDVRTEGHRDWNANGPRQRKSALVGGIDERRWRFPASSPSRIRDYGGWPVYTQQWSRQESHTPPVARSSSELESPSEDDSSSDGKSDDGYYRRSESISKSKRKSKLKVTPKKASEARERRRATSPRNAGRLGSKTELSREEICSEEWRSTSSSVSVPATVFAPVSQAPNTVSFSRT
ncbi:hypothetical protein SCAR479_06921 [Seiridium cardinale]|uniref:Uncharacterized protein n=1 Tax=Seiridium cardinale TaxID=138064 RepID=A0ABR2XRA1_9PEZI